MKSSYSHLKCCLKRNPNGHNSISRNLASPRKFPQSPWPHHTNKTRQRLWTHTFFYCSIIHRSIVFHLFTVHMHWIVFCLFVWMQFVQKAVHKFLSPPQAFSRLLGRTLTFRFSARHAEAPEILMRDTAPLETNSAEAEGRKEGGREVEEKE